MWGGKHAGYLLSCWGMIYGLLADLVLALHALFVVFVIWEDELEVQQVQMYELIKP